jgi:hypothetical protein
MFVQMLFGQVIPLIAIPPGVIVSCLVTLSFIGVGRNNLLLLSLAPRLSIVLKLLWLHWLLHDMGVSQTSSSPIFCDNRNAIQIVHNDVFHERTKHIEIDCHFVRHHLLQGTLRLCPIASVDQLVDVFTKAHPPGRFRDLVSKLKLASKPPP